MLQLEKQNREARQRVRKELESLPEYQYMKHRRRQELQAKGIKIEEIEEPDESVKADSQQTKSTDPKKFSSFSKVQPQAAPKFVVYGIKGGSKAPVSEYSLDENIPEFLLIQLELPLAPSSIELELEISNCDLAVASKSENHTSHNYHLELPLSYIIDDNPSGTFTLYFVVHRNMIFVLFVLNFFVHFVLRATYITSRMSEFPIVQKSTSKGRTGR